MKSGKVSESNVSAKGLRAGISGRVIGDLYHFLLNCSWVYLLIIAFTAFVLANVAFGFAYLAEEESIKNAHPGSFTDAFFFSVQTMMTIGYGTMAPQTFYANILVALEAFTGLLGFALMTGLFFAKFSRPTTRVLFSRVAVISVRDRIPSLMFRLANQRGNRIVEAQLHAVLVRNETTAEGEFVRRFYDLELARNQNAIFFLSWTAIHPITEKSPLYGATEASLRAEEAEIVISMIGLDETFSQTVHARYSYQADDIVWNAHFADILHRLPNRRWMIDYTRFHDVVELHSRGSGCVQG